MELLDFSYLVDENISTSLIEFLQARDLNIISVREQGWQGASDITLVQLAKKKILLFSLMIQISVK